MVLRSKKHPSKVFLHLAYSRGWTKTALSGVVQGVPIFLDVIHALSLLSSEERGGLPVIKSNSQTETAGVANSFINRGRLSVVEASSLSSHTTVKN